MKYFSAFASRLPLALLLLALLATAAVACKRGQTVEELGNYVVTTDDFNEYYNTQVERLTRLANVDKATVARALCSASHPMERQIADEMDPENTYKKYRQLRIVEQVAQLDGFMDRPVVKRILHQFMLEQAAQLYIQEKLEKYMRFTPEQKEEKCRELRVRDPGRFGPLPLDQCVTLAERVLVSEETKKRYGPVMDEIKERVAVKKTTFNKDEYLKNNVEGYRALRKSGGCAIDESAPAGGMKPKVGEPAKKSESPAPLPGGLPNSP